MGEAIGDPRGFREAIMVSVGRLLANSLSLTSSSRLGGDGWPCPLRRNITYSAIWASAQVPQDAGLPGMG